MQQSNSQAHMTHLGKRFLLMVFFIVMLGVVRFVLWAILLVQFLSHLTAGKVHPSVTRAGASVADYVYRIWLFLTYNTEMTPFPFNRNSQKIERY